MSAIIKEKIKFLILKYLCFIICKRETILDNLEAKVKAEIFRMKNKKSTKSSREKK